MKRSPIALRPESKFKTINVSAVTQFKHAKL